MHSLATIDCLFWMEFVESKDLGQCTYPGVSMAAEAFATDHNHALPTVSVQPGPAAATHAFCFLQIRSYVSPYGSRQYLSFTTGIAELVWLVLMSSTQTLSTVSCHSLSLMCFSCAGIMLRVGR